MTNTAADDSKILGELPFLESIIWNFAGVSKLLALGGQLSVFSSGRKIVWCEMSCT